MTPERIATMLGDNDVMTSAQQDALEICHFCSEPILGETHFSDDDFLDPFCSARCVSKYDANRLNEGPEDAAMAQ